VQLLQKSFFKKGLIYNLTSIDACWVTDYQAGGYFKTMIRHTTPFKATTKQRYQNARSQALSKGLVEMGRRKMSSQGSIKQIIPVSWNLNPGYNKEFAPEFYLRLTQHGKAYLQLEQDDVSSITHIESHDQPQVILSFAPSSTLRGSGALTDRYSCLQNNDEHLELVTQYLQSAEKTGNSTISANSDHPSTYASDSTKMSDLCSTFDTKVHAADSNDVAASSSGSNAGQSRNFDSNPNEICSKHIGTYQAQEITSVSLDKNPFGSNLIKSNTSIGGTAGASTESFELVSPVLSKTTTSVITSLPYNNGLLILCKCVKTLQVNSMRNNYSFDFHTHWVTDSSVSQHYKSCVSVEKQRASNDTAFKLIDYKVARENAILKRLVEAGRRQLVPNSDSSTKSIVVVNWGENSGTKYGLSSEVYLRLTQFGVAELTKMQTHRRQKQQEQMD
jgi:hypothetical protein